MDNNTSVAALLQRQKAYFTTGATLPYAARMAALNKLEAAVCAHEEALYAALKADLGKSRTESFMCEVGLVCSELRWMKKHLKQLMKKRRVATPIAHFASSSFMAPSPYGTVLVMSPWNYPVLLSLDPLVAALAAGNTVILKPSAYSAATSRVIAQLIAEAFPPEQVAVVTGGREENQALLHQHFDKIFFTGSTAVGKEVMACAAEFLTPVTLELGGKSPCIVEQTAKIDLAARRIVFGKFVNCGQTCVAPDYILCHESIRDALAEAIVKEIRAQLGDNPLENENYGRLISQKHYERVKGLIDPKKVICGGVWDDQTCRIAPTVMTDMTWEDKVMQEEIFGPVLPMLTYRELSDALRTVEARPRPLALYCFTESKKVARQVLDTCRFGGGCINDCIIHLATSNMPFGGVGESGMGCYHGKFGFEEFSHLRSIVDKKTWLDLEVRYQPYSRLKDKLLRLFVK